MLVYIYDIRARNKREFNRVKRVFYYRLKKLNLPKGAFLTKSTIAVSEDRERAMDGFFKGFGNAVSAYKIYSERIERI